MSISNAIIGLILLALAVAGAWRWYDNHVRAQSKNQMMETAAGDVRETAECHLEAFKLRPGLTETDLEVQAAFMDICMEARGYIFLPGCTEATPNAGRAYNLGYKFNSICWRKNGSWSLALAGRFLGLCVRLLRLALDSNLANNLFASSRDNRRPGDGFSTTTMGMSMNDNDGALAVIVIGQWVTVSLLANG